MDILIIGYTAFLFGWVFIMIGVIKDNKRQIKEDREFLEKQKERLKYPPWKPI